MMRLRQLLLFIGLATAILSANAAERVVRILAIGNSFSEDAVEQNLHEICASQGEETVIANLFIPACTIDIHYKNISNSLPAYSYRKILRSGQKKVKEKVTLEEALRDEQWDYISFQQGSEFSGLFTSYVRLGALISKVREIVGRTPIFMWHMTWAYAPNSTHAGYDKYDNNQLQMYHDIVSCARRTLRKYTQIKILIPSGTAIQDARTILVAGNDLTRDGYHLNLTLGRYIAACTWYKAIFHKPFTEKVYAPKTISSNDARTARLAATTAVNHPFEITPLHYISAR